MNIQAELSLYPLKTDFLENAVKIFIRGISQPGISVVPGEMSTVVAGESEEVFRVIGECFGNACSTDDVVLVAKFSNACPEKATSKEGETSFKKSIGVTSGLKATDLRKGAMKMAVKIDESKCTGCGICSQTCPVGAITIDRVAKINTNICISCGSCVEKCPKDAIFTEWTETVSSFRGSSLPPPNITTTSTAVSQNPSRVFGNQSGFQQVNRRVGFLEQIFNFFGRSVGYGGGRGRGRGGRRGRGKGMRP